jgi:hypothetical protein
MEFDSLYQNAVRRGLETRFCHDIVALRFLHELATQRGVPEMYPDMHIRCKMTGYILEGKTEEEARLFVRAEENGHAFKTSCFPRTIFHLEDTAPAVHVMDASYYSRLPRSTLVNMVDRRCPLHGNTDDMVLSLLLADKNGVPDVDSLIDAAKDRYYLPPLVLSYYQHRAIPHHKVFTGTEENVYPVPTYYREGDEFILVE